MSLKNFCDQHGYYISETIPSNWNRYWDGIPSVTTLLSILVDPKFEYIKKNHKQALHDAANRGKETHAKAESFYRWLGTTLHPQILKFHIVHWVEVIWLEERFEKDISGTVDCIWYMSKEWKTYNIDYKNTMHTSEKYKLQLAGYQYLNGNPWWLLYLSDKKYIYDTNITEEHLELFLELKDLFFHKFHQWMFHQQKN